MEENSVKASTRTGAPAPNIDPPAVESGAVLDTSNPTSRRFPMMGPGIGRPAVVDENDPQAIAARASNDGTATHDRSPAVSAGATIPTSARGSSVTPSSATRG